MSTALETLAARVNELSPAQHGFAWFDARNTLGHGKGPLKGMIVPAKDLHDVAGMPTSYGSTQRTRLATTTDPFLSRLIARGAIIAGKTQTSELGLTAYCEPIGMPAPSNPLLPGHTPGGSSGGAAVALKNMLIDAAHASDGGGSIRVPAAACGLVGLKPAHDSAGGRPAVQGFITRDIATQALLLDVTPVSRPLKIGVLLDPIHAETPVDATYINAVLSAAHALEKGGHQIVGLDVPYGPWAFEAFSDVLAMRTASITGHLSPIASWLRDRGASLSSSERGLTLKAFNSVHDAVLKSWSVDVALMPTLAFAPPKIGHFSALPPEEDFLAQTRWTPWATIFNMTGGAALTLPTGVQLGGIRAGEAELLSLGAQLEHL